MRSNYTTSLFLFNLPVFVLALLLGAAVAFAQPACVSGVYMAGDTSADAMDVDDDDDGLIEICTLLGLDHVRHNLAGTSYKNSATATEVTTGCPGTGCTGYELVKDLDFEDDTDAGYDVAWTAGAGGAGWPPIGDATTPFSGSFDGGEYAIRNLFINRGEDRVGLFGQLGATGSLEDLGVEDVAVEGQKFAGGLVGQTLGSSTITSCHATGVVTSRSGNAGVLVGENSGTITLCHATGTATGRLETGILVGENLGTIRSSNSAGSAQSVDSSAGGLTGQNNGTITSCYSVGSAVTIEGSVGGLAGFNTGMIKWCYATGAATASSDGNAGGLVGKNNGTITSCYSTGSAHQNVPGDLGGLVGRMTGGGTVHNSFWDTGTSNIETLGAGTGKTTAEMKMLPLTDLGDTGGLSWDIGTTDQYPAVKSYKDNGAETPMQVAGDLLVGQPCPRAECGPLLRIAAGTSPVTEGTAAEFTLTREGDTSATLAVTVTVTGDTGFISGMLPTGATFGVDEAMITLTIPTGNEVDEADGTIMVAVQEVANSYRVDSDNGSAEVTVEDDDLVEVSISGGDAVTEGEPAEFTVTRVGDTTEALTIMVNVTQTGDFLTASTTSPVTVEILATGDTATLPVDTDDDDGDEPDGMITATIPASASTYRLGTSTAMVAVMDNDVVPPAPADLTAPSTDTTSVSLTWTAVVAVPPVTGYQVKVSDGAGASVITAWTEITGSTVATVSHTVTGLTALTAYTFAIRAKNPAGDGEVATVEATTLALPGAPTALMAGTPTSTTVPLTWTVATTGGAATAFQFKVSNADGTEIITAWTDIMNSDATTASYTVTGLTAETAYTFAIRSKNTAGESAGVTVTATTATAPTTPPAAPSGLLAPAAETTSTSVGLTWTAAATDADISAYQVKVSSVATGATGVTGWTNIMESSVTTTSYTVTGLTAETAYTFAIRAKNTAGDGEAATIDATTTAVGLPGAPTALMAGTPTSTTVPLTWTVATTGGDATAFQFKVSNADGTEIITDWTDIMNSDATTSSYTVTGLTAETAYTFAIRAKNTAGESAGVTVTATTATAPTTPPAVPSGLLAPAAETTSTSVGLTWTAAATDADISAYQVQVSNADGTMVITAWMNIMGSSVTTTSYTVTGLTAETAYTFAIRAKNTAGESDEVTVTATTKAASATLSFGNETIDDQTYTEDTAIPPLTLPEATGGTGPYTYTLTPVPAGLEFDAGTRILSGTPTTATDTATTHTYTVTDTATTLTAALMFTITVNAAGTFGIGSQGAGVHVYPNPAGDVLHIEFSGAGEYGIALLTLTGQQVFGGRQVGGGSRTLDVSSLTRGVYVLKIEDSEGVSHIFRIIR